MATFPYMPFYVNDYLSSSKVSCMALEEQGAYVRLLCHCWASQDASLPKDDIALALLSGLGKSWTKSSGNRIKKCFIDHPTKADHLTNEKLYDVWQQQVIRAEKCAQGGRKSGESRRRGFKGSSNTLGNSVRTQSELNNEPKPNYSDSYSELDLHTHPHAGKDQPKLPDQTEGGTWFEGPSQDFLRWWNTLPNGMRAGKRECWEKWPETLVDIQGHHDLPEDLAIEHLVTRTSLFARSPRGLQSKFRWSAITFLDAGHYDDDPAAWEIPVETRKPKTPEKPTVKPLTDEERKRLTSK